MMQPIERFMATLNQRLEAGARAYGDKSFQRQTSHVESEVQQELIDTVGWLYVLWTQAMRKADIIHGGEKVYRREFLDRLRQRVSRNDRGRLDVPPGDGAYGVLVDLEVLALDSIQHALLFEQRLNSACRALEVASWMAPIRGRRGGTPDPRSSD